MAVVALAAGCGGTHADFTPNSSSFITRDSAPLYPSAKQARAWATKWCQVKVGMTLAEADRIMGKPTEKFSDQHDWIGFQWQFDAFIKSDGTIQQLQSTEEGSTPATSTVACGTPAPGAPDSKIRT
jgi:hypothetical protein